MTVKIYVGYKEVYDLCRKLANKVKFWQPDSLVAITRGGLVPTGILAQMLNIKDIKVISLSSYDGELRKEPQLINNLDISRNQKILFIDDILDSGETIKFIKNLYPNFINIRFATIYAKEQSNYMELLDYEPYITSNHWIVFPWEVDYVFNSNE